MLRNRLVIAAALTLAVASRAAAQTPSSTSATTSTTTSQTQTATDQSKQADKAEKKAEKKASQTSTTTTMMSGTASGDVQTRPATTTFMGDTGLWNVPTGEVLPAKKWSLSAYRVNFDDNQGFSDVSNWPVTFGYGIADRAE